LFFNYYIFVFILPYYNAINLPFSVFTTFISLTCVPEPAVSASTVPSVTFACVATLAKLAEATVVKGTPAVSAVKINVTVPVAVTGSVQALIKDLSPVTISVAVGVASEVNS